MHLPGLASPQLLLKSGFCFNYEGWNLGARGTPQKIEGAERAVIRRLMGCLLKQVCGQGRGIGTQSLRLECWQVATLLPSLHRFVFWTPTSHLAFLTRQKPTVHGLADFLTPSLKSCFLSLTASHPFVFMGQGKNPRTWWGRKLSGVSVSGPLRFPSSCSGNFYRFYPTGDRLLRT